MNNFSILTNQVWHQSDELWNASWKLRMCTEDILSATAELQNMSGFDFITVQLKQLYERSRQQYGVMAHMSQVLRQVARLYHNCEQSSLEKLEGFHSPVIRKDSNLWRGGLATNPLWSIQNPYCIWREPDPVLLEDLQIGIHRMIPMEVMKQFVASP